MSSTRRKSPQRTRSQERSLRRVRQHTTTTKHNHQSNDWTEDSAFLSGASSFTGDDERKCSARTKRGGLRPQQSTTSGMTFALVSSQEEASSSSASVSTDGDDEPFHETLASLALSQVFPPDYSVLGKSSTLFEVDPPRPVAAAKRRLQDQASVESHPTQRDMTLEQKAWAGIESVLRQSSNSVHREDVLSPDVCRALSDSYSTFHSPSVVVVDEEPGSAPVLSTQDEEEDEHPSNIPAASSDDREDSFTMSPTQELTGYLGRLTITKGSKGMPELMHASFSSIQTDVQSLASAVTPANNDVDNNAIVIQPNDHHQEHVMEEFMNGMVAFSGQQKLSAEDAKAKDPPGGKKEEWTKNSFAVNFEDSYLSEGKLQEEHTDDHQHSNKTTSKTARDKAQQLMSPRQHRKLKKPLSSSMTQFKPHDDPPTSPRRTRSTSPAKIRARSSSPANEKTKNVNDSTRSASRHGGESPHRRRVRRQHSKNANKSVGEFSQETLPIDFDASLPSTDPRNLVTRRSFKTPVQNVREKHPMPFDDDEDPFFSPAAFTNASAIPTPKNRNHWPTLLVVTSSKEEEKLNNSMPSLVTLKETELSQVEAAQVRKWASFGDLGLDEMFRDEEDGLMQAPKSPASPKRRGGRRRTRYHYTHQRKSIPRKKLAVHSSAENALTEDDNNGVEAFVNYFKPEEQVSSTPNPRPVQQPSGLLPSLQRFLRSPRKDRKKVDAIDKLGPLSKLKKGMGSLLCRNKKSASTPNAARIDTGHRDAQFYPDMEDDRDESGYGNLLD